MVVVPSRESTPWWPIQAGWAAARPVVATHQAAPGLLEHEQDSVLVYPSENSLVWGIERVLFDADLRRPWDEQAGKAGRTLRLERRGRADRRTAGRRRQQDERSFQNHTNSRKHSREWSRIVAHDGSLMLRHPESYFVSFV